MFGIFKRVAELEERVEKLEQRPAHGFRVGDTVIGNSKADRYTITKPGWIGKVTDTSAAMGDLEVEGYSVDSECFDLYEPKTKKKAALIYQFKKGDKVQHIFTGEVDIVKSVPGMKRYDA